LPDSGVLALISGDGHSGQDVSQGRTQRGFDCVWFPRPRVIKGHGTVIFPMVENCRELSLELMSFDVAPQQDLYTKQGVAVTVEAVAQIKVRSDQASILDRGRAVPDQERRLSARA
jgi:flotillin